MLLHRARLASFRKRPKWPGNVDPEEMSRAGFFFLPDRENPDNCECFFCGANLSGWRVDDDPAREHLLCNPECQWARVIGAQDHSVADRLATFTNWPHRTRNFGPSPLALAQAGFFFNPGSAGDDSAECAYCRICLNRWEPEDSPRQVHMETRPDCEYVQGLYETSSLVESSLGTIPVLEPTPAILAPPSEYEESVYGNVLDESTADASTAEASTAEASTAEASTAEASTADASNDAINDAPASVPLESRFDRPLDSPNSSVYETAAGISIDETQVTVDASTDAESDITIGARSQNTTLGSHADGAGVPPTSEISMVSVQVEEVTVASESDTSAAPQDNLEDPETPNASLRKSVAPEEPSLSVFQSAFTSTPFSRMSPTKMISSVMPSPLKGLPIDLGRTSFGTQPQNDQPASTSSLYPRLPSFPSMHTAEDLVENTPFDALPHAEPHAEPRTEPPAALDPMHTIEKSSYPSDLGRDHSTPSPIRSEQARDFIVGSSPVKNSFDQLIQDLEVEPNASHDSFLDTTAPVPATPLQLDSSFRSEDPLTVEITKPTKKELVDEFSRVLPQTSIDFLMQAKGQTVREWQLLLADEVERQILKITEEAVQEAETQRQRVIAEIKAQYGQ